MGGGRTQTTTSNTTHTAPQWQQDQINNVYQRGNTALSQMPTGPNADQLTAMDWLRTAAPGLSTGSQELRDLGTATARGDFLDPASNPWIQGAVEAAQRPLRDQLDQNVLQIGDAAQLSGAYGGDRERLLRGQALGDFNKNALDVANTTYYNNYTNERQLQQNAPALLAAANSLGLAPGQLMGVLGDQQFAWDSEMPWTGLDNMASLLSLGSQYGTTNTVGTQPVQGGGIGGFTQGAVGGASAGSAFGPWGAGIGGVIGGLGGLFG